MAKLLRMESLHFASREGGRLLNPSLHFDHLRQRQTTLRAAARLLPPFGDAERREIGQLSLEPLHSPLVLLQPLSHGLAALPIGQPGNSEGFLHGGERLSRHRGRQREAGEKRRFVVRS